MSTYHAIECNVCGKLEQISLVARTGTEDSYSYLNCYKPHMQLPKNWSFDENNKWELCSEKCRGTVLMQKAQRMMNEEPPVESIVSGFRAIFTKLGILKGDQS